MATAAHFKFLIVNYIEQYTILEGEDLLAFAITYAGLLGHPADYTLRQNNDMLREAARSTKIGHVFDPSNMTTFLSADRLFIQAVSEVAANLGYCTTWGKLDTLCNAQPQ